MAPVSGSMTAPLDVLEVEADAEDGGGGRDDVTTRRGGGCCCWAAIFLWVPLCPNLPLTDHFAICCFDFLLDFIGCRRLHRLAFNFRPSQEPFYSDVKMY